MKASFHTYPRGWPFRPSAWRERLRSPHQHRFIWTKAMIKGMRRNGVRAYIGPSKRPTNSDIAVLWSWKRDAITKAFLSSGRHVLVMERGFIHPRVEWASLAVDGFNGRGRFRPAPDNGERWERLFSHHLKPWRTEPGDYALVIGQVPGDTALGGCDIVEWAERTTAELLKLGHRVVYRPHPERPTPCPEGAELSTGTLDEDLRNADRVVCYNSTAAVESILAGVPTVICDRGSVAYPMAAHNVSEPLVRPDRTKWCHDMAWRQWSLEEFENGDAWQHVAPLLSD